MSISPNTPPTFWEAEPEHDRPPYMDPETKARIADEGLTFVVEDIRTAKTTYGPTWMLEVDFEGERWTLAMSHTPYRDAQLTRMQTHLAAHGPVPCGLESFEGTHGRGWMLTAPASR